MSKGAKAAAGAFMLLVVVAALAPLRHKPPKGDSFPLSNYPMFARRAVDATMSLTYALGFDSDGKRYYLRPDLVANGEVLQARAVLHNARRSGQARSKELCKEIAKRVAKDGDFETVRTIKITHGTHDAVAFLARGEMGPEKTVASCAVKR